MIDHFHHICIQTLDYDSSKKFYMEVLGMKLVKETENFHSRRYNTWLRNDYLQIELQTPKDGKTFSVGSKEATGISHICFYVEDIDSLYESIRSKDPDCFLKKNGLDIYEVEGSKLMKVITPDGAIIEYRDQEEL